MAGASDGCNEIRIRDFINNTARKTNTRFGKSLRQGKVQTRLLEIHII